MNTTRLQLRSRRRPNSGLVRIAVEGEALTTKVAFDLDSRVLNESADPSLASAAIHEAMTRSSVGSAFEQVGDLVHFASEIELDIRSENLYSLPWEQALRELADESVIPLMHRLVSGVQYRTDPPQAPLRVLAFQMGGPTVRPHILRHYRYSVSRDGIVTSPESGTVARCDVLHLRRLGKRGSTEMHLWDPSGKQPGIASLVRKTGARVVILEGESAFQADLLNLGHNLSRRCRAGVVVATPAVSNASRFSGQLYAGIIHDQPLDVAAFTTWDLGQTVFIGPHDSEQGLSLSRASASVLNERSVALERMQAAIRRTQLWMRDSDNPLQQMQQKMRETALETLSTNHARLESTAKWLDYVHESEGSDKQVEISKHSAQTTEATESEQSQTRRVVNTRFIHDQQTVAASRHLEPSADYGFEVQIGHPAAHSNNRSNKSLPEDELESHMDEKGLPLEVVLHSDEFEIAESSGPLLLPPLPRETTPLVFNVKTPAAEGPVSASLKIYWKNNLIQALNVNADVGRLSKEVRGNHTLVEWTLDGSLEDIKSLGPKTINLFTSQEGSGKEATHTLSVQGAQLSARTRLRPAVLSRALETSRERLRNVAKVIYSKRTLFRRRNRLSPEALESELRLLAFRGRDLHGALLPNQHYEGAVNAMVDLPTTLQVTNADSLEQAFPWGMVYDHAISGRAALCPDFAGVLGGKISTLEQLQCFSQRCAHADDVSVVCPSGFWGFRHFIEQPLSLTGEPIDAMCRRIKAKSRSLTVAGFEFKSLEPHLQAIRKLKEVSLNGPEFTHSGLQRALAREDPIVYFYCHGVRGDDFDGTVLRLGRAGGEEVYLRRSELRDLKVHWLAVRPLVFLNGCHTVDADPGSLGSFNSALRNCGASGVIGTEIETHQDLAKEVGERFLKDFLVGKRTKTLGAAMRRVRLSLLLQANPLGLAYTTYGLSDLKLDVAA